MSKLKQITNPHKNILQDFEKRVSNWIHLIDAFDGLSLAVPSITPSIFYIYKKIPRWDSSPISKLHIVWSEEYDAHMIRPTEIFSSSLISKAPLRATRNKSTIFIPQKGVHQPPYYRTGFCILVLGCFCHSKAKAKAHEGHCMLLLEVAAASVTNWCAVEVNNSIVNLPHAVLY